MAIEKEITIKGNTSDADSKIKKLSDSVSRLSDIVEDNNKKLNKGLEDAEKSAKKATKGVSGLSKGFKALGSSIKALGIGAVISLVAGLTSAFSKNQRIMDGVNTVLTTVSNVFSQLTTSLLNVYDAVSSNTESFDALGKVLNGILTLIITPLKLAFFGIKLGIQQAQLSWEKSFFGGKDNDKIKELTVGIAETKEAIFNTGKDAVKAGEDIYNNFSEAITETGDIAKKTQEELSKVSIKNAYENAKAQTQLENNSKLAVAQQQRLVEIYDRQAEKLRQLRDDDSRTIKERIKSNEDLNAVLEMQEKAMIKTAEAQISSARIALDQNNNIENRVALIEALSNKEAVLAQIEGFRSEQLSNRNSLLKEQQEIENLIYDSQSQRELERQKINESIETDEIKKIEIKKQYLDLEFEILKEDLERKRLIYKEGTLAREQAEQDFLNSKIRIESEVTQTELKESKLRQEMSKKLEDAKVSFAGNTLNLLGGILEEGSELAKGVAVAQATISGIEGVQNAFTSGAKNPITTIFPAFPFVQAGLAGGFSALQIGKILSTDSKSGGGASSSQSEGISAPSFNLVEGTADNQIAQSISNNNSKPVQAFVVSKSVTSAQEMDRNIEKSATL